MDLVFLLSYYMPETLLAKLNMRRSSAPSLGEKMKRAKFSVPLKSIAMPSKVTASEIAGKFGIKIAGESLTNKGDNASDRNKGKTNSNNVKPAPVHPERTNFLPPTVNDLTEKNYKKIESHNQVGEHTVEKYYSVVWCKASSKKHKKWEGDAILVCWVKSVVLKDMEGKEIGRSGGYKTSELSSLDEGSMLFVGGKEVEVQGSISKDSYQSGCCFNDVVCNNVTASKVTSVRRLKPFVPHNIKSSPVMYFPRFDPTKDGALVMPKVEIEHPHEYVDVVVDPFISSCLRPHQREGVLFLYECIMGMKNVGHGVILADEMGLGKTIQCIAIIWTLLKQGPRKGTPVLRKVLIVTPGSLVKNWSNEILKWLGSERLKPFVVSSNNRVDEFLLHSNIPVMIISYEMYLRCIDDVQKVKFDLIVCDEAHRLKNAGIKTASVISSLAIKRRILLTGTPIQNNLQEFFTLAEIAIPGVLGAQSGFRRIFIQPITMSQQPGCSVEEREIGDKRAEQLKDITSSFCLRRTSDINKAYLPPKVEYVLFIRLNELQVTLYKHILQSQFVCSCLLSTYNGSRHLVCINTLRKLCNHPNLVYSTMKTKMNMDSIEERETSSLLSLFPDNISTIDPLVYSTKIFVLHELLKKAKVDHEKCVVVSNSTKSLDILQRFCKIHSYEFVRLDGQTQTQSRQHIVDRFNDMTSHIAVFLLSSKAGGVGLNLIGACNLVLYDIDWNPANDIQAMARIWRDGQKKRVKMYRLLHTDTIEEKIYQRQIIKQALSKAVVDCLSSKKTEFNREDLKNLFSYKESATCSTHELLQCQKCQNEENDSEVMSSLIGSNVKSLTSSVNSASMAELMRWEHIHDVEHCQNDALRQIPCITFIFKNESH